jgi:hypothetical protein
LKQKDKDKNPTNNIFIIREKNHLVSTKKAIGHRFSKSVDIGSHKNN